MYKYIQYSCIIFILILVNFNPAQAWVVRYNGPGNERDEARAVVVDNAGNIYSRATVPAQAPTLTMRR